jgi:type III restriction enzyme
MEFKFNANQDFQIKAIEAVTELFTGQPKIEVGLSVFDELSAVSNQLTLDKDEILKNLNVVQTKNNIRPDPALISVEQTIETEAGPEDVSFYNFSVEMETGTGKTYVYLRTALDLFRQYGFRKYIVVVPSVAIREGILKTLSVTARHFRELYDNVPYRFHAYHSANLSQVRQFALSDSVEIMVMTIAAFNKAQNIIRQATDRLQGDTPIHLIQATRPILILDEPQNMESEKSVEALALLKPLMALRYSATHLNPYNLIYRLTPFEAYRQGLVKKIEVASVVSEDDTIRPFLRLESIKSEKNTIKAKLAVHKLMKNGTIKETTITIKPTDSLQKKTNRAEYADYGIDEIKPGAGYIRFSNNVEINVGEEIGTNKEAIFESQIRYAIEEHFRKQARLKKAGIKVLSLFFIDRVDNYAQKDGIIRKLFFRLFGELKNDYTDWKDKKPEEVQAAYFASRRTRTGTIIYQDSKSGEAEKDKAVYNLIMKEKERLLSFDEPVAFIFSHSALREGWDNPNVFQICTLNQSVSEIRKRQEVGRGVRLCLDQTGNRIQDEKINFLTVVANESYEKFVSELQSEIASDYQKEIEARYGKPIDKLSDEERRRIEEEYGEGILPPKPANARRRITSRLRKEYTLKPEFKGLWEKIKHKTRYAVRIDTDKLIQDVVATLDRAQFQPPRVSITKVLLNADDKEVFSALQLSSAKTVVDLTGRYPLPNLVDVMANLMEHTTPPVYLTRRTLLKIINKVCSACQQAALANPNNFATTAVSIIKEKLADQLVAGIQYEKINEWYQMEMLELEIPGWEDYLVPADHSVYDHVACDSDIERQFVADLEKREDVKLYLKLPSWFTVDTPVGNYNPDWAIVMEERDEHGEPTDKPLLYLVRETKSTHSRDKLHPDERRKIECGEKHFGDALEVDV